MSDLARLMLDRSPQMQVLVNPADLLILMANAPLLLALGYSLAQIQCLKITKVKSALPDVFLLGRCAQRGVPGAARPRRTMRRRLISCHASG